MFILNHFLDETLILSSVLIPNRKAASKTNSATGAGGIDQQAYNCAGQWNRYPNVVLVDFFDQGNPLDAAKMMNGIS
jgi:hypothetical protein